MKNLFSLIIALTVTSVTVFGQTTSIVVPKFDDKYSKYVQMLEDGEIDIDYKDFRYSLLESEQFKIISGKLRELFDLREKIDKQMDKSDYNKVISTTKKMLSIDYANMLAHSILSHTYQIIGDSINAQKHKIILLGLLHSIIDNRDGKSRETAWSVIQISEEYFILDMLGAKLKYRNTYNDNNGGLCDKMDVIIDGENKTYYFEIIQY